MGFGEGFVGHDVCLDCCLKGGGGSQGCCSAWRCGFEGGEGARLYSDFSPGIGRYYTVLLLSP